MLNFFKSKYTKLLAIALSAILLSSGVSAVFTDNASTEVQNLNTGTGSPLIVNIQGPALVSQGVLTT